MAIIKGNAVVNATTYELYEVTGGGYTVTITNVYLGDIGGTVTLIINGGTERTLSDGESTVLDNVSTLKFVGVANDEQDAAVDTEGNPLFYKDETYTLTGDITITGFQHV